MTVRVLHFASSLGPDAGGRAASRIVPALPQDRIESLVVNLLGPTLFPVCDTPTICHRIRYPLDLSRFAAIRRTVLDFRPDVIHAWGPLATKIAEVFRKKRLVVSHADRRSNWLDQFLTRGADAVAAMNNSERNRYRAMGVPTNRIWTLPFGLDPIPSVDRSALRNSLGIPNTAKLLVASGFFDANARLKHVAWAFDVVRIVQPHLHLLIVGDGPKRPDVERFSWMLGKRDYRVHFAGFHADFESIVAAADAVWITHAVGGTTVANEAMTHSVPVFAYRTLDMESLPRSHVTLVPPNDPVALAAATNRWLSAPIPISPLQIPLAPLASALADVYDDVTSR